MIPLKGKLRGKVRRKFVAVAAFRMSIIPIAFFLYGTTIGAESVPRPLDTEEREIRGLVPVVRLFCAPCLDRYAQELYPRSLWWELRDIDQATVTRSERWNRRRTGALTIPPPIVVPSDSSEHLVLMIDGAVFYTEHVYVRVAEVWVNLAWYLGLPQDRALPTLPGYIRVERAPPRGEPDAEMLF